MKKAKKSSKRAKLYLFPKKLKLRKIMPKHLKICKIYGVKNSKMLFLELLEKKQFYRIPAYMG